MPSDLWHLAVIVFAVILLGISKTGFGGGMGVVVVPLLTLAMRPGDMLAVMAILLVAVDLLSNIHYLDSYDWPTLRWLLPGAVVGVAVGMVILHWIDASSPDKAAFDRRLSLLIGLICLTVVILQVIRLAGVQLHSIAHGRTGGVVVGGVSGTVSTVSHTAGPIVMLYMLETRLEKRRLVGTMLLYTLLINALKLAAFAVSGIVTLATLKSTLWMFPLLPVGTIAGAWMNRRLSQKPFAVIMYVTAAYAAGQMIWAALK